MIPMRYWLGSGSMCQKRVVDRSRIAQRHDQESYS
jgi:hypothetical protein